MLFLDLFGHFFYLLYVTNTYLSKQYEVTKETWKSIYESHSAFYRLSSNTNELQKQNMKSMKKVLRKMWHTYKEAMEMYGQAILMSKNI